MNFIFSRKIPAFFIQLKSETLLNSIFNNGQRLFTYPVAKITSNRVFCSSSEQSGIEFRPVQIEELKKKYTKPVDWLPFEWHKRKRHNPFENSGDLVKELEYDPVWLKPDFELSDELITASEDIKYSFSLATASKGDIKEVVIRNILKKVQRHPNDFRSLEVQIALRTINIRSVFEHSRQHKKEIRGGRVGLYIMVNRRNRLLKRLYRIDRERFNWLIQELKLEYTPKTLGGRPEKYNKKWDLRRMTREYSKMVIKNKKLAYQEELKQQQADFLKEKEEILAWIEEEEKELANLNV